MVWETHPGSRRRKISLKASLEYASAYGLRQDYALDSTTEKIPPASCRVVLQLQPTVRDTPTSAPPAKYFRSTPNTHKQSDLHVVTTLDSARTSLVWCSS